MVYSQAACRTCAAWPIDGGYLAWVHNMRMRCGDLLRMVLNKQIQKSFSPPEVPVIVVSLTRADNSDFCLSLLQGISEVAVTENWRVINLEFWGGSIPEGLQPVGALVDQLPDSPLAGALREQGIPAVRIGKLPHPQDDDLPVVLPNLKEAGSMAADHLMERGYRNLGFLGHAECKLSAQMRTGFQMRTLTSGHAPRVLEFYSCTVGQVGMENLLPYRTRQVLEWLKTISRPAGLAVYEGFWAGDITAQCQRLGIAVPEDIAIISYGLHASLYCRTAPVPITSIEPDHTAMGKTAARLLKQLIGGQKVPQRTYCHPTPVTVRRSTDMLAVDDPIVARSLSFIWDHIGGFLDVMVVADHLGVSRRKLERAFRATLGRGVHQEIRRKRLETCAKLLTTTSMTIADTAKSVGFGSRNHMHDAFRQVYGCTPGEFRRNQDRQTAQ